MKKSQIIKKARALLENPENWGKGVFEDGGRYCARGAIRKFCHEAGHHNFPTDQWARCANAFAFAEPPKHYYLAEFNDSATHLEVMMALDFLILQALDEEREEARSEKA